jgi:hypothetical protein
MPAGWLRAGIVVSALVILHFHAGNDECPAAREDGAHPRGGGLLVAMFPPAAATALQ